MKKAAVLVIILGMLISTSTYSVNASNESNFDLKIKYLMFKTHMPTLSACIIKNDSIAWYDSYTISKFFPLKKPSLNSCFPICSISKTVLGTAMMQLYERGLFNLDEDVDNYLNFNVRNPKYPDVPITFRMLLAHEASLQDETLGQHINIGLLWFRFPEIYPYPLIKEMIVPDGRFYKPSIWEDRVPGHGSGYSNIDITLLEHLLEVITGESYTDYCKENIFEPLRMHNTSFSYDDFNKNQLENQYFPIGRIYIRLPYINYPYSSGGVMSSTEDLSHFLIAHMNGGEWKGNRILNESTVEEMHKIQYPESTARGDHKYGLGWINWDGDVEGVVFQGHAGHGYTETTMMMMNETHDIGIIFSTNTRVPFRVEPAWNELLMLLTKKAKEY